MVKLFLAAALALGSASTLAQSAAAAPPKLMIVISVDQLSSDLFDEYRPQFTAGLARLAQGTVFRNGFQGHAATETCPGHATILTGSRPSRSGIIANSWFDLSLGRSDKSVYCAEDESVPGSSSSSYTVSPVHLKVKTLGELMKARWPGSRSVAVAGKDRSAVMMSGRSVDQRWYWDGKAFATDLKSAAVPRSIAGTNAALAVAIAAPREALELPAFCSAKARQIAVEGGGNPVGAGRFARAAGDTRGFRNSPEFDGATLALSAALIGEKKLGQGKGTDLIAIGLSATDYVGHSYGTNGAEMCLQLLSLDRDLGDFFRLLDGQGVDYSVALTADHGGQDIPERLRTQGIADAVRIDPALSATAMGKVIGARLGLGGPMLIGDFGGDVYIDKGLKAGDRARVLQQALAAYRAHPQIEAVFSADQLKRSPSPTTTPDRWTLIERAKASFDPRRSGDLVVLLRRRVTPIPNTKSYVATHGSPWDYDRRVPVLFWRKGMAPATREQPVETVDIMPTLAASIGLGVQAGSIDGKCLLGVHGIACPPR